MSGTIDLKNWFLRHIENFGLRPAAPPPIEYQYAFDTAVEHLISEIGGSHPNLKSDIGFLCGYHVARMFGVIISMFSFLDRGIKHDVSASFERDDTRQTGELVFRLTVTADCQNNQSPSIDVIWRVSMDDYSGSSIPINHLPKRLSDNILASISEGQLLSPRQLKVLLEMIHPDCIVDSYAVNDDQVLIGYKWKRFPFGAVPVNDFTITLKKAGSSLE